MEPSETTGDRTLRRAVYPGSFDPPTIAHVHLAETAIEQLGLDHVDFAISLDTLGKDDADLTPIDARVAELDAISKEDPRIAVVTTSDSLLADIAEGYDVVILGADKWHQVLDPTWYGDLDARNDALQRLPLVALAARPPWSVPGEDDIAEPPEGVEVVLLDTDPSHHPVSATAVRAGRDDWRAVPSTGTRPPGATNRGPLFFIIIIALLLAAAGVLVTLLSDAEDSTPATAGSRGMILDPPRARPDFILTDQNGLPYDFGKETGEQLTFLFFGYTYCPDICPITMATLSAALSDSIGIGGRIVFVSTDPVRDTPERLKEWLKPFGSNVVGLTGTLEQVEAAQRAAGTVVAIPETPNAKGGYLVGHSSAVTVYTPDDLAHLQLGSGTTQAEWMQEIALINANTTWNQRNGIDVADAVASVPNAGSGAVYLSITNNGDDNELLGASTPVAAAASIHVTSGSTMSDATSIALPKGQTVRLEPGGSHIMTMGPLTELKVGDAFDLTLRFAKGRSVTVSVLVVTYDELASRIS